MKIDLNRGWSFIKTCSEAFISGAELAGVSEVELPHTVSVTPFDYFDESEYQTVCCYRRRLDVPAEWIGKRIFLCIGAAAHFAEVFLNGEKLSEHRSGYTAFKTELTERLRAGENLLAIRVDSRETLDQPPFGFVIDYMTYGGLYREAWLEVREKTFIEDVFVKPEGSGHISAEVTVSGPADGMTLRHTVLDGERVIAQKECGVNNAPEFRAEGITKWSLDEPKLYTFRTELRSGSETVDVFETRIGFRDASFLADGFYLNGERIRIRGLNRHQSYPFVGYAMPANVQRFDADILKNELGCNAVRTSHYPQSQAFIDRCDELGLLVFTEIPGWQHIGGEDWKQQALENVREMILQYRNHPSIVLWGVRINESNDDDALYEQTNELAHRLDPTRQTGGVRCIKKSNLLEDVYTYNDFVHEGGNKGCEPKKNVTSDVKKPYLVTEYCGHMFPTKTFDCEEHRLEHALRHANVLDAAAGTEGLAGSFGWCMFDYNTHMDFGSGDRVCYHGVLDMFRNKKLAAEVYASQQDERPVLELSSLMDIGEHPAANRGKVFAFTNADAVRLYKNGSFIAEFPKSHTPYKNLAHPPIDIDDFIGDAIEKNEPFKPKQAAYVKDLINYSSRFGFSHLRPRHYFKAAWLMLRYRMSFQDAYALYGKYNSNWGDAATTYRIEAVKDGKTVGVIEKGPAKSVQLTAEASADTLSDGASYDAALVRIALRDQY
ncbi:MAG: glycoside hydrolase family 2 protein, partial [Clostridia bacterium]|nr:glycoside hydrolase family 2 protein [Clostridia bacterium]